MITKAPKGTVDIFGEDMKLFQRFEAVCKKLCVDFGVQEIKTPSFEHTELFARGIGDTTDVVQKEMYTFMDKGGRSITLKPEGTAGVVRAYIENGMFNTPQPVKLFYFEPSFRYENPQAGRLRQFYQFGVEVLGSPHPECDTEVIVLVYELLRRLGIKNIELHINSLGGASCRQKYNSALKEYLCDNREKLCKTCAERMDKNPLRVLDCKESGCRSVVAAAPSSIDTLDTECREHFDSVLNLLSGMGIPYVVNKNLVRGLDYYTRTVFEFISEDDSLGSQSTVCGGGRYDGLVAECGGPDTSAVGFAVGVNRLMLAMRSANEDTHIVDGLVYIGSLGEEGRKRACEIAYELRRTGCIAECDLLRRSVKAQMKYADKIGANYSLIVGSDEIAGDNCTVKNMATGEKTDMRLSELVNLFSAKN